MDTCSGDLLYLPKMNKHRTHQIDDLAQRVFRNALPSSWVPNEQPNDYGKDYLVEIGEDNGDLTGSSFFVQLKGQERSVITTDGSLVKYSLETKYAIYYLDRIKDLPVFLFVVDVKKKTGWWLFLQPLLETDQTWRKKNSLTVGLPVGNAITDTARLRMAVDEAKKWMRLHHPQSIHESVIAHKERIIRTDPRFDVNVSLVNDQPHFGLLAKEEVPLTVTFSGDPKEVEKKISDLVDKGASITFQPGEIRVEGSKLFEQIEQVGCAMRSAVVFTGTVTLSCRDAEGRELARLPDIPGRFRGGRKEIWFEGGLINSPLSIQLGPIAVGVGGSAHMDLNLHRWDGQRLLLLAYFDRLYHFFQALSRSAKISIECHQDGNNVFSATPPLQCQPFPATMILYLETLMKARKVCERFSANPVWTVKAFDRDTHENAEELYGIFIGSGWSQRMPHVRLTANFEKKTFRSDVAKQWKKPGQIRIMATYTYWLFGDKIEVGRLVHEYSEMAMQRKKPQTRAGARKRAKQKSTRRRVAEKVVEVTIVGSEATVMSIRVAKPEDDSLIAEI